MLNFVSGYLAGLSVGVYCLGFCLPVFLPILLSEKRNTKKSLLVLVEFSVGRLVGYFLFGLVFGWLGQTIQVSWIHTLVSLANFWMGILMILYGLGRINQQFCAFLPFAKIRWPALVGFLTGVNVCPPFVASLTYVFNLKSTIRSIVYFLAFFFGTSTYIIPTAFFGLLTRFPWVQKIAQVSGVVIGIYFISRSLLGN